MDDRLIDDCGVSMYCDMHAHSRRHNIFIYGCENKRNAEKKLTEQVFPLMLHKNVADKVSETHVFVRLFLLWPFWRLLFQVLLK